MKSPKRWNAIEDQLLAMSKMLPGESYGLDIKPDLKPAVERLFAEEYLIRPQIDRICTNAALLGGFPEHALISPDEVMFLQMRIQCALDFCNQVWPETASQSPFGEAPENWTDFEIFSWLLIDLWKMRFDVWMKLCAMELIGPFPFYGIKPA